MEDPDQLTQEDFLQKVRARLSAAENGSCSTELIKAAWQAKKGIFACVSELKARARKERRGQTA